MSMAVGAGLWHLRLDFSAYLGFGNKHSPSFGGLRGSSKHSWIYQWTSTESGSLTRATMATQRISTSA